LVWDTNVAGVSLFWDPNMAAVRTCTKQNLLRLIYVSQCNRYVMSSSECVS